MPRVHSARKVFLDFSVSSGANLMKALLERGIPVASSCHGEGICRKCVMQIVHVSDVDSRSELLSKETSPKNETGLSGLSDLSGAQSSQPHSLDGFPEEEKVLSCQFYIYDDVKVDTPYW